jgi:hypothetical protein
MYEVFQRDDIDAVLIATGDRWHATASMIAAQHGKDIYSEKPCTMTIRESQELDETILRYGRIFQAGTQRGNVENFKVAVDLARSGKLGNIKAVYAGIIRLEKDLPWLPGKALMEALKTLKGSLRVGVIISLGDRREVAAVPALAKIAKAEGKNQALASAALTSLAQIASDEAGEAILGVLAEGSAEAKISAARAALIAAEQMEKDDRKEAAGKLRKAAAGVGVPAPIKKTAGK